MLTWHLQLVFLGLPCAAFAIPSAMTFQGRILKSDGSPFEQASVSFLFQILSPDGTCSLYQEQINSYGMSGSKGLFDVPIGTGTKQFPLAGGGAVSLIP